MKHWIHYLSSTFTICLSSFAFSQSDFSTSKGDTQQTHLIGFDKGFVYGQVFNDLDQDARRDFREKGIDQVIVYLDQNNNAVRDEDEIFTRSLRSGFYFMPNVPEGEYTVRQEVPFGWRNISGGEGASLQPTIINTDEDNPVIQIIGGDETGENEYPFMVAVGFTAGEDFFQFCGGVLITDRWVATAAHCSVGIDDPASVNVLVGSTNTNDGSGQVLDIASVILHPNYLQVPNEPGGPSGVIGGYDIALWELSEPIALHESGLQTVGMLEQSNADLAADGILATAVGWGVSDLQSNLLQDVHLPIFDTEICSSVYFDAINFDTQICGGTPEGGIDACQGDSGGPLLVRDFQKHAWKLAGITSYGNGCALPGNPGVWARVSALSDWAMTTAVEESRAHAITVHPFSFTQANFGNLSTRYEPENEIPPRWQLVNSEIENDSSQNMIFNWRILDESAVPRAFDCTVDADSDAPRAPITTDCFAGENGLVIPQIEDGVYMTFLSSSFEDTEFSRIKGVIFGSPAETNTTGALTIEDPIDPDYGLTYYIDYFDIEGLSSEKAIALQVTSEGIEDLFVALYDRDVREAQGFGGVLQTTFSIGVNQSTPEIIFVPQPGVKYLLGVSSFNTEIVGDYRVTVINEGEAIPTTLGSPSVITQDRRGLKKIPELKTVVSYPEMP